MGEPSDAARSKAAESDTRITLMGRLRAGPGDSHAWAQFVEWYGQKIYIWCRSWGLQEADAQDVTQDVFVKLSTRMQDFTYDPKGSFRAWLKTVTQHAWHDFLIKQRKPGRGNGSDEATQRLAAIEARDERQLPEPDELGRVIASLQFAVAAHVKIADEIVLL